MLSSRRSSLIIGQINGFAISLLPSSVSPQAANHTSIQINFNVESPRDTADSTRPNQITRPITNNISTNSANSSWLSTSSICLLY
mmetsp:Transcript_30932/g.73728  ORF Transcript_30932/g.73728 Transcript_30932/m.73728 type:complete len:85 (-) Transcript_30932:1219-1473(-)